MEKELYHYGVKGMKWGVRRSPNGGGIAGAIRRKQRSNAERDLADIKSKQRRVNSELRELNGYERNPQGLAKSKISTAIRRSQIKSLNKISEKLKRLEKENINTLKELDSIEKYQAKKRAADKAAKELANQKMQEAKKKQEEHVSSLFKKHPDLYDDFGGPDQIDDYELLQLVMWEKGYGDL